MPVSAEAWDIFCNVIDNFGDIGVSWRLARQLANEYGFDVRLWVDDLASFCRLCHEARMTEIQHCRGVEVRHWMPNFHQVEPGDVVIEAFGCRLPESFLEKMAGMERQPVWINLEYLSAEDWVRDCHLMPSPHPPLVKYFFFPGFTPDTGGLIIERDLLARRDAFQGDRQSLDMFWKAHGGKPEGVFVVSLFGYENAALDGLLHAWSDGVDKILCLVPEGRIAAQVKSDLNFEGWRFLRGNLEVRIIPFVPQEQYDLLLWACDINFVRGEDSFVRAQWAGKTFVWQIYPQDDGVHLKKLEAFISRYGAPSPAADALHRFWLAWNGTGDAGVAWKDFLNFRPDLDAHARKWAEKMSQNNLVQNLLDFCGGKG